MRKHEFFRLMNTKGANPQHIKNLLVSLGVKLEDITDFNGQLLYMTEEKWRDIPQSTKRKIWNAKWNGKLPVEVGEK